MLGQPYRYGGDGPGGFDCSGLVRYAWNKAGIRLPRTTRDQYRASRAIRPEELRPGDLLFFRLAGAGVSHVGIYEGGGRFLHAPSTGKRVTRAQLDNPYWKKHFVGARRPY